MIQVVLNHSEKGRALSIYQTQKIQIIKSSLLVSMASGPLSHLPYILLSVAESHICSNEQIKLNLFFKRLILGVCALNDVCICMCLVIHSWDCVYAHFRTFILMHASSLARNMEIYINEACYSYLLFRAK